MGNCGPSYIANVASMCNACSHLTKPLSGVHNEVGHMGVTSWCSSIGRRKEEVFGAVPLPMRELPTRDYMAEGLHQTFPSCIFLLMSTSWSSCTRPHCCFIHICIRCSVVVITSDVDVNEATVWMCVGTFIKVEVSTDVWWYMLSRCD